MAPSEELTSGKGIVSLFHDRLDEVGQEIGIRSIAAGHLWAALDCFETVESTYWRYRHHVRLLQLLAYTENLFNAPKGQVDFFFLQENDKFQSDRGVYIDALTNGTELIPMYLPNEPVTRPGIGKAGGITLHSDKVSSLFANFGALENPAKLAVIDAIERLNVARAPLRYCDERSSLLNAVIGMEILFNLPKDAKANEFGDALAGFFQIERLKHWGRSAYDVRSSIVHYRRRRGENRHDDRRYFESNDERRDFESDLNTYVSQGESGGQFRHLQIAKKVLSELLLAIIEGRTPSAVDIEFFLNTNETPVRNLCQALKAHLRIPDSYLSDLSDIAANRIGGTLAEHRKIIGAVLNELFERFSDEAVFHFQSLNFKDAQAVARSLLAAHTRLREIMDSDREQGIQDMDVYLRLGTFDRFLYEESMIIARLLFDYATRTRHQQ